MEAAVTAAMDGGYHDDQDDLRHEPADAAGRDPELDERLMKLEIKLTEAEDWIDALNTIVARQQDQIELLMRELSDLRRRQDQQPGAFRSLMEEIPPHY